MSKQKLIVLRKIASVQLCGDRDETVNHIINECIKLDQKEY